MFLDQFDDAVVRSVSPKPRREPDGEVAAAKHSDRFVAHSVIDQLDRVGVRSTPSGDPLRKPTLCLRSVVPPTIGTRTHDVVSVDDPAHAQNRTAGSVEKNLRIESHYPSYSRGVRRDISKRHVVIGTDDFGSIVTYHRRLDADGRGWMNVSPRIPEDIEIPATPGPLAVLSKRGPAVPLLSWVPQPENPDVVAEFGLLHPHSRAIRADYLSDMPAGVELIQDHPRRGIVGIVTSAADVEVALPWLCERIVALCLLPMEPAVDVVLHQRAEVPTT